MDNERIFILPGNNAEQRILDFFDEMCAGLVSIGQLAELHKTYNNRADDVGQLQAYHEAAAALLTLIAHSADWLNERRGAMYDAITFTK